MAKRRAQQPGLSIADPVGRLEVLAVLTRPTCQRPWLRTRDERLRVAARRRYPDWRRHLLLVRRETLVGWHRRGWGLVWRWRSRHPSAGRGSAPGCALIATTARDNPRWGAERIRGELLKVGFVASRRSGQRHRRRGPARPPSPSWRTFLRNHRLSIRAADLLTVQTVTFRTPYVLLFVAHDRRELVHLNVTAHATAASVWRRLIAATPWGQSPRYLVRNRDAAYSRGFVGRARGLGIETVLTPIRVPRANAIAERLVGTLRRGCLHHAIVLNEAHPRALLTECAAHHNAERPHPTLELDTPIQRIRPAHGSIRASPVLGGPHHAYERVA